MQPREIVRRTLEFDSPPRVPHQVWALPWAEIHHPAAVQEVRDRFPDDIVGCPSFLHEDPPGHGDRYAVGTSVDEWGCEFHNLEAGIIGEVKRPQLTDWADVDRVRVPRECLTVDVDQVREFCRGEERFVLAGCCPRIFEQLQFIRGTEDLLCDLVDPPPELETLIRRMHEFYLEQIHLWGKTDVDGIMMMDDWGSQQSLLISPRMWRRLFRPLYEDYFRSAREYGKYVFFHSDGQIADVYADLVELGVHAINSQIFCMGVPELGARFAGQVTFWGDFDRQHLLPNGTRADILAAAESMREHLYRDGGLIAQTEFGPGSRPENVITYLEYWDE